MFHSFCNETRSQYIRLIHLCHRSASLPARQLLLSAFLWFQKAGLPPSEAPMASSYKMKGIFKGFKIISQIFAAKEQEMEIGCPTDVKHVAHIGWNTSTGTLTGNAPPSWMIGLGESSDLSSLGNFALATSAGTSWASQDFEPRDISPLEIASEITGQQDAATAQPCVPGVPRPPKKTRRGKKRTATDSLATSSMPKDSSVSAASAADAVGANDTMQ